MQLIEFGRGVTVLGGLPVPIITGGDGTGYDIVGKGIAMPESFQNTFEIRREMAISCLAA